MFLVSCCAVCYTFHLKTMFGSFLHRVICRRANVLFMLFVFVAYSQGFIYYINPWYSGVHILTVEAGTAYPSRALEFTTQFFGRVHVAHLLSF